VNVLIGVVDLYCMYSTQCPQVTLDPLPPISCSCTPIRLHAFIYRMIGGIGSTQCGRHLHRFVVVEQHPAGKPALSMIGGTIRQVVRVVAESGVAVHYAVLIKSCRPHTLPALKIVFDAQYYRGHMPVIAIVITEGGPVSCTAGKAARFKAKGIGLCGKWPQRAVTHRYTVSVPAELRTRSGILQVILSLVLGHMCPFDKRIKKRIVHIFAEALPAVTPVFKHI